MPSAIALRCARAKLFQHNCRTRQTLLRLEPQNFIPAATIPLRQSSTSSSSDEQDISSLLATPTWSIKTLLPDITDPSTTQPISRAQLLHLLRLSALPPPSSAQEESSMLKTLSAQIHFVKQIQQVDTTDVTPLRSLRDETDRAYQERTINISTLKSSLEREEFVGRNRRIFRTRAEKEKRPDGESWEEDGALLKSGEVVMGKYFVVRSSEANVD
ncbi:predicted protein [Uncinocarpus reesii 1704]|uniref:Glutamyl-tRNA amidotransferase complex subunit Gta3 domain-containing protein n=1 Tax=Uncinocarpus reesii (strain UAMH 1704) TaxID=336963 RepID=C4JV36_UNCRE|nr:uncharacterized protein UREG_06428 [Uncinocarpus reesii 1704]EEP81563.1 predicted protein [Uncinocarpus reesii 1704]